MCFDGLVNSFDPKVICGFTHESITIIIYLFFMCVFYLYLLDIVSNTL